MTSKKKQVFSYSFQSFRLRYKIKSSTTISPNSNDRAPSFIIKYTFRLTESENYLCFAQKMQDIIKKGGIAGCILLFYALIELKAGKPIVAGRMSTLKSKSRYATKGTRPWPGGHLWSLGARK